MDLKTDSLSATTEEPKTGHADLPVISYRVAEWVSTADGSKAPEQVHLILETAIQEVNLVVRFKSAFELDRMIAALTRHREGVWGNSD